MQLMSGLRIDFSNGLMFVIILPIVRLNYVRQEDMSLPKKGAIYNHACKIGTICQNSMRIERFGCLVI